MTDSTIPDGFAADHELDACGLLCPEPMMMLHPQVNGMDEGATLRVVATDPSTQRDIARFCQFLGHALLANAEIDGRFYYLLRKGG